MPHIHTYIIDYLVYSIHAYIYTNMQNSAHTHTHILLKLLSYSLTSPLMGSDCKSVQFCAYLSTFIQLLPMCVSALNELLGTSIKCGALSVVGVDNLAGLYK